MPEIVFENDTYRLIAGATLLPDIPGRRLALLLHVKHPGTGLFHYTRLYTPSDIDPLTEIASIEVSKGSEGDSGPLCVVTYKDGAEEQLRLHSQSVSPNFPNGKKS